jgi:predicted SnoaL-like aldol condensation-catalyzing enzyme/sugar lactone lactonase YvrE
MRLARLVLVLALAVSALASVVGPSAVFAQDEDAEANMAVVTRLVEELANAQDLEVIPEIFSPDFVEHNNGQDMEFGGIEGIQDSWAESFAFFETLEVTVDEMFAAGDKVVMRYTMSVRNGEAGTTGTYIARLEDGLIAESWESHDSLTLMAGLGMAAPVDPTLETNKVTLMRVVEEVLNEKNLDVLEEIFAPGLVEHMPSGDETYASIEDLQASFAEYFATFPDAEYTVEDVIAEGDRVVLRYSVTSDLFGSPVQGVYIAQFEDGKIVEAWHQSDDLSALVALGLVEMPEMVATEFVTVATGFNGPQGILVDDDSNIWVIDSGLGGDTEAEWVNPDSGEVDSAMMGDSARVVMVNPDGEQTEVATLPSIAVGTETLGGARLAVLDGAVYATSGQWLGVLGEDRMPLAAAVVVINEDGSVTEVANTYDIEAAENPGEFVVDSHPYGLAAGPDGMLWVADAGANDLLVVDPATGDVALAAVFDGLPSPLPNPTRGDAMEADPVPTGVAFGDDGTVYVSLLSGFPFIPGSAKVVTLDADGNVADYATGLTMLTDLRAGPDGALYAAQIGVFTEQGPMPNSGMIIRVEEGDGSQVVAAGLSFPTSLDFDADGNAYVTINGVGAPGSGAVVMLPALVEAPGVPVADMMAEMME